MNRATGGRFAIVGLGCVLPGAANPAEFWKLLVGDAHAFVPLPTERFDPEAWAAHPNSTCDVPLGGLLPRFDLDIRALRIPPVEIAQLHRIERAGLCAMLQALSDAGVERGAQAAPRTQVFVAASTLGPDPSIDQRPRIYRFQLAAPIKASVHEVTPDRATELGTLIDRTFEQAAPPVVVDSLATSANLVAGRICRAFDLQGGNVAVDAGPASSSAALELAIERLGADECDLAVVCALSPVVSASRIVRLKRDGCLAQGAPRPFDPDSDGTLPGEGGVAIVLTREGFAGMRSPYALIEGIAGRQVAAADGECTNLHRAIVSAAEDAMRQAGIQRTEIHAVESRAAGLAELDRAELEALTHAYGQAPPVTSTVSNVGDLDPGAGLVAVLKAALGLTHRSWPGRTASGARNELVPKRVVVSDAGQAPMVYQVIMCRTDVEPATRSAPRRPTGAAEDKLAIVGVGLVAPGAADVSHFWANTLACVDPLQDIPPERWQIDELAPAGSDLAYAMRSRLAGTVDVEAAVELARGILGRPQADVEPGAALGLVAARRAFEDARLADRGFAPHRAAVFIGQLPIRPWESEAEREILAVQHLRQARAVLRAAGLSDAQLEAIATIARSRASKGTPSRCDIDVYSGIGAAQLIARAHGFSGRILSLDAACGSTPAAIHAAKLALLAEYIDVALVGGIACNLLPEYYVGLSVLGVRASFDARPFHPGADGFVPSEGAGVLVLKRLSDAQRDGDRVYAVVCGLGASSDGAGRSLWTPRPEGIQRAIRSALEQAKTAPESVELIEAHGAATPASDSAEIESYRAVYASGLSSRPVWLGTAKAQAGHLSSASAAIGLIKTALALHNAVLPPGADPLEHEVLSSVQQPLRVIRDARPWCAASNHPRRAAVTAIGLGGINYHLVLEEAAAHPPSERFYSPRRRASRFVVELAPVKLTERTTARSLRGAHLLLVKDRADAWETVSRTLRQHGCQVTVVDPTDPAPVEFQCDGIVDLSSLALRTPPQRYTPEDAVRSAVVTFSILKALPVEKLRSGWYAAVVSLGGDLGITRGAANPRGARFLGLARALQREFPTLTCKVLDFAPETEVASIASKLVQELQSGDPSVTVAYRDGQRFVPRFQLAERSRSIASIPPGTRVLFSGGGRGVMFDCARALRRLGARVLISGRTRPPDPDTPWLRMNEEAFSAYKRAQLLRAWQHRRSTPAQLQQEFAVIERQRELAHNLESADRLGLHLDYAVCDVSDSGQVDDLVRSACARWGGIDMLVHGAMFEYSAALDRKTADQVRRTFATKVQGLMHLLASTQRYGQRPCVICFGSIAGVLGNSGQTDYAAADTLMMATLREACLPDQPHTTISWPAWQDTGSVAAHPELGAQLLDEGVTSIETDEGVDWFVEELAHPAGDHVVIASEDMLERWAWDADGGPRQELDDQGRPLSAGRWPMVDVVDERADGVVCLTRRLTLASDPFLEQHLLNGVPTLPLTFGLELMAEGAALACPEFVIESLLDVYVDVPIKLFESRPLDLHVRICPQAPPSANERLLQIKVASDLRVGERVAPDAQVHYTGRAVLVRQRRAHNLLGTRTPPDVDRAGRLASRSFFHGLDEPITLGPVFDRPAWLRILPKEVTGRVRARSQRGLLARTAAPRFLIDPLGVDAGLQIAASWDGYTNGWVSAPISLGRIDFNAPQPATNAFTVRATLSSIESHVVTYDLVGFAENGAQVFRIESLRQRRFARSRTSGARPLSNHEVNQDNLSATATPSFRRP